MVLRTSIMYDNLHLYFHVTAWARHWYWEDFFSFFIKGKHATTFHYYSIFAGNVNKCVGLWWVVESHEMCWNLAKCGKTWTIARKCLGKFVECIGRFRNVVKCFAIYWNYEILWNVVECQKVDSAGMRRIMMGRGG